MADLEKCNTTQSQTKEEETLDKVAKQNPEEIASFKIIAKRPCKTVKKQYTKHEREIKWMKIFVTIILTVYDMGSDVALAVNYKMNGCNTWASLTILFCSVPFFVGFIILCCVPARVLFGKEKAPLNEDAVNQIWLMWRHAECLFESGPQLILQLYIMALPDNLPGNTSTGLNSTGEQTI